MSDEASMDPSSEHRYRFPLLGAIQDLHCVCTGALEMDSKESVENLAEFLEMRSATWNRSEGMPWSPFDAIVYSLLQTVLGEWRREKRQ